VNVHGFHGTIVLLQENQPLSPNGAVETTMEEASNVV